ncbi:MAG: NUDIX domain-containing protein [Terriglobales bacterium]
MSSAPRAITAPPPAKAGPRLFHLLSRLFVAVYGHFPVFGFLPCSVGVLRRGGSILVLERSDGLGWGFPGGMAWPWESEEQTLRREYLEETGMTITTARFLFRYLDHHHIHSRIAVFEVEAEGEPVGSWEGMPFWVTPAELQPHLFACHAEILQRLEQSQFFAEER